jgi:flagellar FliL protein
MPRLLTRLPPLLLPLLLATLPVQAENADGPVTYIPLDPPLVLNLTGGRGTHFMQLSAQLAVGSPADAELVKTHMPVLRNAMILYLSGRDVETARSTREREVWRQELQAEIQAVLAELTGREPVRGLYFTGFVIQ